MKLVDDGTAYEIQAGGRTTPPRQGRTRCIPQVEPEKAQAFTSGALGLQALNPEISITGDILWSYTDSEATNKKPDFLFRGLGVHAEAYLDPFTRFNAAFSVNEDEATLGRHPLLGDDALLSDFIGLPAITPTGDAGRRAYADWQRQHFPGDWQTLSPPHTTQTENIHEDAAHCHAGLGRARGARCPGHR